MNIIVSIKQVPDTTEVKINPETNTLVREGVASIINPFDMYAIEEALRIRENCGGRVTVITMGPPQAEEALRSALALGVDDAVLLSDREFAGADTLVTGYTLAAGVRKLGEFDLIICGKQAADGDTAQVGPQLAHRLAIPFVTFVKKIEEIRPGYLRVERMVETGYETVETKLPALITVVKEINEPRIESLRGKMKAAKAQINIFGSRDLDVDPSCLGLGGSPTQVVTIFTPPPRSTGKVFEGEPDAVVEKLVSELKEQGLV
jgi:electron transfer flavoprotein beta subunit